MTKPRPLTSHSWCTTELEWEQVTYQWNISHFSVIPMNPARRIRTPDFTIPSSEMPSTWRLWLNLFDEMLSLYLELVSSKRDREVAWMRLSIIRNDGSRWKTLNIAAVSFSTSRLPGVYALTTRSALLKNSEQLLPDDTLSIEVELYVLSNTEHRSGILECPSPPPLIYSLDPSCAPDCSVTVDSLGPITFHRAIIHATSPTLLDHLILLSQVDKKSRGKRSNLTSILTWLTGQVLRDLINYVYNDNLPDLPTQLKRVENLFKMAHEYSISPLKCDIETALIGQLGTLEPNRLLLLARETMSTNLESEVSLYVGRHRELMRGKRWIEAITDKPDLLQEQAQKMYRTSVSSRVCTTSKHASSLRILHRWFIIHFDKLSNDVLESLCFGDAQSRSQWRLRLYPNGINRDNAGYLGIELVCLTPSSVPSFEGYVSVGLKVQEYQSQNTRLSPKIDFLSTFSELYTCGRWSDVTIVVGDFKFLLHQMILAAVSPVFKAMFSHNMTEKIDRTVQIDDIEVETFRTVVWYIYTELIPILGDLTIAEKILFAADKYQIDPLKSIVEQVILGLLNIENVAHIVHVAEKYNATNLFHQSMGFIKSNLFAVMMTTAWAELSRSNPSLREQLLQ